MDSLSCTEFVDIFDILRNLSKEEGFTVVNLGDYKLELYHKNYGKF